MQKKSVLAVVAVVLVACLTVVGTFAYITNVQKPIKNVFTIGNVDITMDEEGGEEPTDPTSPERNFTMVPKTTVTKDATVTVGKTSQDAYIFVVVKEECKAVKTADPLKYYDFSDYVDYTLNTTDFALLTGYKNVYYLKYTAPDTTPEQDTVYHLINDTDSDDKGDITIKDLTDVQIAAAKDAEISLSFQAAAVQAEGLEGDDDAAKLATAWSAVSSKMEVTAVADN